MCRDVTDKVARPYSSRQLRTMNDEGLSGQSALNNPRYCIRRNLIISGLGDSGATSSKNTAQGSMSEACIRTLHWRWHNRTRNILTPEDQNQAYILHIAFHEL